jgi:hypothetical protein
MIAATLGNAEALGGLTIADTSLGTTPPVASGTVGLDVVDSAGASTLPSGYAFAIAAGS